MTGDELLEQLQAYALRSKSPRIDVRGFLRTLPQELVTPEIVEDHLKELAYKGAIAMEQEEGQITTVTLPDLPTIALIEEYRRVAADVERSFPRAETAPMPIPPVSIVAMDAEGKLGVLFDPQGGSLPPVTKVVFPGDVPSLVVPRACVRTELIDAVVARINRYLQGNRNRAYIESKLDTLLRGSEVQVRQSLEDITLRPRKAAATILQPTDISFRFWNHLAKVVIQDTGRKAERTEADVSLLQSAHLVTWAVFHHKGVAQREAERAADRKALEQQIRKPPFVFEHRELYELHDENGVTYSSKHSREFIHEFLTEMLHKRDASGLPVLLRFHHDAGKDYFAHRDLVVPVFLNLLTEAGDALRIDYVKEWLDEMRRDRTPPSSQSDALFETDLRRVVSDRYAVLSVLANGPLLFALLQSAGAMPEAADELSRCFLPGGKLKPMSRLLEVSRAALWREVLSYLPFWQSVPLFRAIARALRKLLHGHPTSPRAAVPQSAETTRPPHDSSAARDSGATERRQLQQFNARLRALLSRYVPEGSSEPQVREELIDRWNPIIEQGPKEDLVQDVNALVQDFARPVRRLLIAQPPDSTRVHMLAEQLASSRSLSQIGNREALLRYLELSLIETLLRPEAATTRTHAGTRRA